jgi:type II secretory pathway pseudopilin PulG
VRQGHPDTEARGTKHRTLIIVVALVVIAVFAGAAALRWHESRRTAQRNDAVREAAATVVEGIQMWSVDHADSFPDSRLVRDGPLSFDYTTETVGAEPSTWPVNPFTGKPMRQGTGPGDFTYTALDADGGATASVVEKPRVPYQCGGYRLIPYGAEGRPLAVLGQSTWDEAYFGELLDLRALVQAWVHDHGSAPAATLVTRDGLGRTYAHTLYSYWSGAWPVNPWKGVPMRQGRSQGDFRYVPGANGHFRLTGWDAAGNPVD